jgi:hypothetical protein
MGPELVLTLMSSWWLILFNRLADWLRIMAVVWASIFSAMQVGPVSHGGILVTTNQFLRPSGPRVEFSGSPADLAVTAGITPGYPAPASMVADNDLAPGQIVQAISASAFWPAEWRRPRRRPPHSLPGGQPVRPPRSGRLDLLQPDQHRPHD